MYTLRYKESDIVLIICYQIYSKFTAGVTDTSGNLLLVSLRTAANLLPVSLTPMANLPTTPAVVAKFVAYVIDTGGKFATCVIDTGGKFSRCSVPEPDSWWRGGAERPPAGRSAPFYIYT